ncbi:MAG: hypothetical protein AAF657_21815 [Acidobacteriota bacterium]
MGFLNRLLAGDPKRDLERATAALDKGDAERALELALRVAKKGGLADQQHAKALLARARETLAASALEKASMAVTSEYFEDAAEWVRTALEYVEGEAQRQELEKRASALEAQAREAEAQAAFELLPGPEAGPEAATELDPESHFHALVGMLAEEVADLYRARPTAFRYAYIDLNEGQLEGAQAALDALLTDGDDEIVRFERGRCRLMLGDGAGAAEDFEAVWESLGEAPLDLLGEMSVPALWAEAKLATGEAEPVLNRLTELSEPVAGSSTLSVRYGEALLLARRDAEARDFLVVAAQRFDYEPILRYQLARALVALDERPSAIDCLEIAIAPSCASGQCAKPPKHLPSLRALSSLYLEAGNQTDRVGELLQLVTRELSGHLTVEDFGLVAKYQEQLGHPEAAERALVEARRLVEAAKRGAGAVTAAAPDLAGGQRAPI